MMRICEVQTLKNVSLRGLGCGRYVNMVIALSQECNFSATGSCLYKVVGPYVPFFLV